MRPGRLQPRRMASDPPSPTVVDPLSLLTSGRVVITVGGTPLVSLRSDERAVDVRLEGARDAGIEISKIVELQEGTPGVVRGAGVLARRLSDLGWTLTLSDAQGALVTMGQGVSRLTAHVKVHPLALRRLLAAFR